MSKRRLVSYKDAGVDINAGDEMVELIKPAVRSTFGPRVLGDLGGFGGLFRLDYREDLFRRNFKEPVLVGCTDGVGSKILLARDSGHLDTVGIDLVAMNVNDLLCCGAEPLFFLDYVAVNKLEPKRVAAIVEGIAAGCREADCALLGGETAEMPDLYAPNDFDLAGFAVGVVERGKIIDGSEVEPGDVIIGLPSSGIHSNGLALARRLAFKEAKLTYDTVVPGIGAPIGDELLKPTRIYVRPVVSVLRRYRVKRVVRAMAHITGGGLVGNVPRVIPDGLCATIDTRSWNVPPIFKFLQSVGVKRDEMFRVFNMGVGYTLVVRSAFANAVVGHFRRQGLDAVAIGRIRKGPNDVELIK
ncbi:MAG TPA: phosphoribosylformylglycinamidine cyclo-ligase [Phycisphaerae bacterium]|nr:phosphoribosylformylglycinamidine cyclo-ligase [Phycisphaerae bacterium]